MSSRTPATPATSPKAATRWHRLLPPQLVLLLIIIMVGTVWLPLPRPFAWPWNLLGIPVAVAGAYVTMANALRFDREQTNIVTFEDPTLLLTDGWYARTRNPMYVGFALILAGVAVLTTSVAAWTGPIAFTVTSNRWYIPFEERRLRAEFGDAYDAYCSRVRRWL